MRDKRVELLRGCPPTGSKPVVFTITPTTHIVQTVGLEPTFPIRGTALNRMRLPVTPRLRAPSGGRTRTPLKGLTFWVLGVYQVTPLTHIIPDMGFEPLNVVEFETTAYTKVLLIGLK